MKHCPECNKNYADPTLSFCLEDGASLIFGPAVEEPETAILSGDPASESRTKFKSYARTFDPDPTRTAPFSNASRTWVFGTAAAVIIFAAAVYFAYFYFPSTTSTKPIDSVAVLPFVNKSGDQESEYLSDGLAESLVYRLSQLPDLKVSPPSSVMRYKSSDTDPVQAGRELGVTAIVTGKIVERDGNLTVSAELIDVRQNKLLWGEQYDRKMSDLLATQREIAREIVANLKLKVSGNERGLAKHYTENNEAYQLYLKARFHWNKRVVEGNYKAIEYLNQAIEKDPTFALAYAGLADAYAVPSSQMAANEAMPKAKAAALKALELDDTLAEAHTSLGRVLTAYDWDWAGADREFKRAIELNPRYALAHEWYGAYLAAVGQLDASVNERRAALEIDPLSPIANMELGQSLYWSRRYEQAIEPFQKSLELDPMLPPTFVYLPLTYEQLGRYDEAIAGYQKMPTKQGNEWASARAGLGYIYAKTGRKQDARVLLAELEDAERKQYVPATSIAHLYIGLGDNDRAIAWLEKGIQQRAFHLQWLKVDPRWDKLRDDPRFADLLRRVGLSN